MLLTCEVYIAPFAGMTESGTEEHNNVSRRVYPGVQSLTSVLRVSGLDLLLLSCLSSCYGFHVLGDLFTFHGQLFVLLISPDNFQLVPIRRTASN